MEIIFRLATQNDIGQYTNLLQQVYEVAYVFPEKGLTKECFSKEIFASKDTQDYLKSNLVINDKQKTFLAFDKNTLIGSITIEDKGNEYELRGFYVALSYQGKGIGTQLWKKVLPFASDKDIVLDLYAHNQKAISMYEKWGFKKDEQKGHVFRHWPEWPEGLEAECFYMRRKKSD
jgi:GNAT superfamily N-acetyltransferase